MYRCCFIRVFDIISHYSEQSSSLSLWIVRLRVTTRTLACSFLCRHKLYYVYCEDIISAVLYCNVLFCSMTFTYLKLADILFSYQLIRRCMAGIS